MRAKIGVELLRSKTIKPNGKKFEVCDTDLKGFTLTVYPDIVKPDGKILPGGKIYGVRYRLPDGKNSRTTIGRHTLLTPAQARDEAEKILRKVKDGIDPNKKEEIRINHTLRSFLDEEYKPWVEVHHKNSKATLGHFGLFQSFLDKPLNEVTGYIVEEWRTARLKSGIKASTVNRDLTAIKSLFSKAVEWGKLAIHPLSKVKPSKVDSGGIVRFLSEEEERRLMKALDDREEKARAERATANAWRKERGYPLYQDLNAVTFADHLKPMVLVSLNAGVRWGELATLAWGCVDLGRAILTVSGGNAKNSKTRHIPLNSIVLDTLKGWQKQSAGPLVFPGRGGNPLINVDRSWSAVLAAAKINNFRWHDMRHHFASWLVMAGVDLNTVRELLGHADLKMTLRYAHLAPEHKASAVAKLVKE